MKKGLFGKVVTAVAGIGALNWGLDSLFNFNLVELLGAKVSVIAYPLVGVAGALLLVNLFVRKKFL